LPYKKNSAIAGDDVKGYPYIFVNIPIIECVMIGAKSRQGISFVSPGQEIKE
jgi:hypothetical protein